MTKDQGLVLTGYQIQLLDDWIGDPETQVTIGWREAFTDPENGEPMDAGLYAWFEGFPEEGFLFLPESHKHV